MPRLPTGVVTFLFTDIEGSTSLLARLGDRYQVLADRHDELLRGSIAAHGGVEVREEGDAFFAVFPSAKEAVAATVDVQRALADEPWSDDGVIRVRIGLHTGEGKLGGGDYTGIDVHRAARIASAGHGGQVLISDATRALVTSNLPDGVSLRDLGDRRLRDLPEDEHLWQLDIDGLETEFPALRALDTRSVGLPRPPDALIGRESETAIISDLVRSHRIVTLTGAGGVGKTRLAIAVADRLADGYADGVFFAPLQEARDRAAVASAMGTALGVREGPDREIESSVAAFLREREALVVLDNFEQVLDAAPLVSEMSDGSPGVDIVVTSRAPLRLSGEHEYNVEPLPAPDPEDPGDPASVADFAAVSLFVERARSVVSGFEVDPDNATAVATITARLDGLPLAIELAAKRVRMLPPAAIADRLDQRLPVLGTGPRDRPERQRTLAATMDWSYELLDAHQQRLFDRLSVFAGGFSLAAAERVCDEDLGIDVFDGLATLIDVNLIRKIDGSDREPRYSMLRVVRDYATQRLTQVDDAAAVEERHAVWMMELVEEAEPHLVMSDLRTWHERLRIEEENLRVALRWAIEEPDAVTGSRIAGSLWRFWLYWGRVREGCEWLERVLALPRADGQDATRAKALTGLGSLRYWQGDPDRASALYEEALEIRRDLGDPKQIADALVDTGWAAAARGESAAALARFDEAVEHYRTAEDELGVAMLRAMDVHGKYVGWTASEASYEEAATATREMVDMYRRLGRLHDAAEWMSIHGADHWKASEYEKALRAERESLRGYHELGQLGRLGLSLKILAAIELKLGHTDRAVRLAAAAERHAEELGGQIGGALAMVGDPLEDARLRMSVGTHARGVAEGRAMSLDETISYALVGPTDRAEGMSRDRYSLTPREREVLDLLARGLSDGEIGEELFISRKTASVHVANIKGKLGATSRVEIVTTAMQLGLTSTEVSDGEKAS